MIKEGNLEEQLFDKYFLEDWILINYGDYLIIFYFIKYCSTLIESYTDTDSYKIAILYLTGKNIVANFEFIVNYFFSKN